MGSMDLTRNHVTWLEWAALDLPAVTRWMTATEAGEAMGLPPKRVRDLARRGVIAHYRLPGGSLRFSELDLRVFQDRIRHPAHVPRPR